MTEFGVKSKDEKDAEKNGVVIDSLFRGEVAGVVFSSHRDKLYIIPRSLLVPDRKKMKNMTNSQRNKMTKNFLIGDNVEFQALPNGFITWVVKIIKIRELILSPDGKNVFHMIGIVSNESPRRLWTLNFGFVEADECQLNLVAPNVPFNCAIEVDLYYGRDEGSMDFYISSFKPEFTYALHSFLSVVMDYEIVYQTPWNKTKKCKEFEKDGEEFVDYVEDGKYVNMLRRHRNVSCVVISEHEFYSRAFPKRRILVAQRRFEVGDYEVGTTLICDMYFCSINDCYIAYDYVPLKNKIAHKVIKDYANAFYVDLCWQTNHYVSAIFDMVSDPFSLLNPSLSSNLRAWVAYEVENNQLNFFVVHAYNKSAPPKSAKQEIEELEKDLVNRVTPNRNEILSTKLEMSKEIVSSSSPLNENNAKKKEEIEIVCLRIIKGLGENAESYKVLQHYELLDDFLSLYNGLSI